MIIIYNFLLFTFSPLLKIYFAKRKKYGKENEFSIKQKFANYEVQFATNKKDKKTIWFHAVSVGETLSIIALINELAKDKNLNILLTTSTITSSEIIKGRLANNIIHQFAPLDKKSYVKKFLNHFKPNLAIWVESELWPNLITESYQRKIPMILLNARISNKNNLKNFCYKLFAKPLLNKFSLILPQENRDLLRIKNLVTEQKNIKYIGNLKLDCPALPYDQAELKKLQTKLQKRKLFLAASTHHGEEQIIADIHHELRQNHPDLLTIIVPRHPKRGADIAQMLKMEKKLSLTIRSKNENITDKTDIYLADTIGELGLFYRLCDIALLGGSLLNVGGHNPIEAAKLDCAIISGPYIHNFTDLYQDLIMHKAVTIASNIYDIEKIINKFLLDKKYLQAQIEHGRKYVLTKNHIIKDTVQEILELI